MTQNNIADVAFELVDLITKAETIALDSDAYYNHLTNGTLEEYYQSVIERLVIDIVCLPADRANHGLPPIDNPDDVGETVVAIADVVARTFGRPSLLIQKDLNKCVNNLPVADVQAARTARTLGLLN